MRQLGSQYEEKWQRCSRISSDVARRNGNGGLLEIQAAEVAAISNRLLSLENSLGLSHGAS